MKNRMKTIVTVLAAGILVGVLVAGARNARAEDNGIGRKPVLGWSSWSFLRKNPSATNIKAQARALKDSGLQKLGYEYINIDDFWYQCPGSQGPNVDEYGRWVTDTSRFPSQGDANGIKAVADYVHSLGMKFGIYLTPGISMQAVKKNTRIQGTQYTADQIAKPSVEEDNYNCKGMVAINYTKPGAQQYINSWADMFASWDVDYIKLDGMYDKNVPDIKAWSEAIRQSGRPMILNITWGRLTPAIAPVLMKYTNQWVVTPDLECYRCEKNGSSYPLTSWTDVAKRFDIAAKWQPYAGPGGFNDYDSIEVGNGKNNGITPDERKTQLSLWALASGPLILGVDLTHLDPRDLKLLKNTAVIAMDQDTIAAKRIVNEPTRQVFAKTAPNGDVIVGLFNTGETAQKVSVEASAVGLPKNEGGYSLDNLWTGKTEKAGGTISVTVPSHGVALYRIKAR
ncbi:MAG: glycoside hydrolase family 27 protein [Acidobacteriaceae bacterium]